MKTRSRGAAFRWLVYALILTTTFAFSLKPAAAMLVPAGLSGEPKTSASERAADMRTIQTALESKLLRERLKDMGLSEAQVDERLSKLSDQEVHQLAAQIHAVNPGGFVVEALLIVVLVLLIVYLSKRV